ncbi:DNAj domain protein [Arthrobotrys musiformis]|uniref:DNAj domain protein n=1 Tax=Arthrobotrys musiformis TaxID=47236 RepID=A0AAV9WLB6_9PEZI
MAASRLRIWPPNIGFVPPPHQTKSRNVLSEAPSPPSIYASKILVCGQQVRCIHHCSPPHQQNRNSQYPDQKSLYDTLGLSPYSSTSEIKRKYYELSKLHHPDRNQGDPTSNDRFIEISHAYRVLSDPVSKASYDGSLKASQSRSDRRRYSQRGPVGGREAGGLSRRPVSPQGPPPSYYRDGHNKSGAQTSTPFPPRFNMDERYRQHYVYQERFKRGTGAHQKPGSKPGYSDLSDFCFRVVAVGTCILLVGVLGRWVITGTGAGS